MAEVMTIWISVGVAAWIGIAVGLSFGVRIGRDMGRCDAKLEELEQRAAPVQHPTDATPNTPSEASE